MVMTSFLLRAILYNPNAIGNIAKWAAELTEFQLDFQPRHAIKSQILCVRGNCDAEVDQMMLEFPITADFAFLAVDGLRIYATHGHVFHPDHLPPLQPGDILLFGHTHVPFQEKRGEVLCLNPGSVSIPKQQTPHSYMALENGVFQWKTLDGKPAII